ncbi:MAG: phosphoglucosamine mutase [Clostridia bacterium]|jgi:phosphoglucosamine mutase
MGRLFGTDGVRGIANLELTADLAYKLGQAGAFVLSSDSKHTAKILVGMDTRISGDLLESAIVAGICSVGAKAICLGVIPTPAVAYLTGLYNADAGIVISASHNPFEFNGIKFFNSKGYKLSDETEIRIESIIQNNSEVLPKPTGEKIGTRTAKESAPEDYIAFAKGTINSDLRGIKVVADCANGAAYKIAPKTFAELGAEVITVSNKPDGTNINKECGSTDLRKLQQCVIENNADIGIAFDGDADRMLAVDEKGTIVDGDQIMAIIGLDMKRKGKLAKNTIVSTVMSNLGFEIMAKREGIEVVRTNVGDRYVLEEMIEHGYTLGGEQSGHIIFLDYNTTGDGLITALNLLSILKETGKKLSSLASVMSIMPQVLRNAKVKNENKLVFMDDELISDKCNKLEAEFNGQGRVLIRPSGTEPLVRVMIEGKNPEYITEKAQELAALIEQRLG